MLQVALGGSYLVSGAAYSYDDSPVYYEPGFSIMYPLEGDVQKCDVAYVLIRKRADATGTTFSSLLASNLSATVRDVTNGELIPATLATNSVHTEWDSTSPSFSPVVLTITNSLDVSSPVVRVRTMDCVVTDSTDDSFISFRITISDDSKFFHYIPVYTDGIGDRAKNSAAGRIISFRVKNNSDGYILFSPYAYLTEVDSGDISSSFSYPLGSIHYSRQDTYNDEEFDFTISSYSPSWVGEGISLISIPGFRKVAALHIDSYLDTKLAEITTDAYVDVGVVGTLSDNSDTFRVYLTR